MKDICSIAVSRLSPNYSAWLNKLRPGVGITDFTPLGARDFEKRIKSFSGLLLTGGGDIHPGKYGNSDISGHSRNIDADRDKLEWEMVEIAISNNVPVLAVCRGMQMLNIVTGGTLMTDIPASVAHAITHRGKEDVYHPVSVLPGSLLFEITQCNPAMVNSSHHQAVDKPGQGIAVTAVSTDGLPEAIEYKYKPNAFCIGVQWHPERMDMDNPMSGLLGKAFLNPQPGW